jgi:hypothetical protein
MIAIAAMILGGGVARATERAWIVQASGGVAGSNSAGAGSNGLGAAGGRTASLGIAAPLRPWFLLGAQLGAFRFGRARGGTEIPEEVFASDPSDAVILSTTFRLQFPVRSGLAPFAIAESGLGWTRQGDVRRTNRYSDPIWTATTRGQRRVGLCSTAGLGLRAVLPGSWPDVETSIRYTSLSGSPIVELGEWRVALAW